MRTAPKDGSLVRLWLRDGSDIVGYYSIRWWGWVDFTDAHPLIRGDIAFRGWKPATDAEVARLTLSAQRKLVEVIGEAVAARPKSAIVKSRKPRPRR